MTKVAPRERIGFDLSRMARLWRARLDERLAPLGLTQAKWVILLHLSRSNGVLPQRELVDRVGVEGPSLVRVLDGLERLGMIQRRDSPSDRRAKTVHLMPAAEPALDTITRIAAELRHEVLLGIEDEELEVCLKVFSRMARNIGAHIGTEAYPQ
ncbi:transcriptional regulator SlyA [Telmatospirillum siberiense]|uniref:Transcriptional regulator SlyA n=1 Tax=Telmatospirillum siberiense TaxID=382514 RepID=A0A2N3Q1P4_9PROT|nr:transcriptional regulator SlyA [Telmatospirillum siberiense]PKU26577.1 transcriptional regulator SlyA [Telmatospirillum siberiense]